MAASLVAILLVSLAIQTPALAQQTGCISSYDPNTNYFPDAYSDEPFALPLGQTVVTAASDFTVQYSTSYKVVKNAFDKTTYVLYQCGAPKPKESEFPAGTRFMEIPLTGFAVDSTVAVPFVQMLGQAATFKETSEFSVAPCVQKLMADGDVTAFNSSDPYAGPVFSGSTYLKPFPMNYISFDTTTDPGPLKRAEWIKYMAVFFNAEARASQVYSQISSSYRCLKDSTSNVTSKPVVAWLSFYDGKWIVSSATYKLEFVADAGGESPAKAFLREYDMAKASDVTAFKTLLASLDVIVDETYLMEGPSSYSIATFAKNAGISATDTTTYKFLATPNAWSTYGRATGAPLFATDWYEGAVAQPQVVLEQLISILHPDLATSPPSGFLYNVAKGDAATVLTTAECTVAPMATVNPDVPMCAVVAPAAPVPDTSSGPAAADKAAASAAPLIASAAAAFALAVASALL